MKVFVNATGAKYGGALTILNMYCKSKSKCLKNEYIIASPIRPECVGGNITWLKVGGSSFFTFVYTLLLSSLHASVLNCKVLVSFNNHNAIFFLGARVNYFHNFLIIVDKSFKYKLIRFVINHLNHRSTLFIFQTEYVLASFKSTFFSDVNNKVCWPGVSLIKLGDFNKKNEFLRKSILVPITDVRMKHKNFSHVIELAINNPDYDISVTAEQINEYEYPLNIKFVSNLSKSDFEKLLNEVHLVFVCSTFETLALPIFEALLTNTHVLVFRRDYITHIIKQFDIEEGITTYDEVKSINLNAICVNKFVYNKEKIIKSNWNF